MRDSETKLFFEQNEFIFIVGAARSGTTWLNNLVSLHPQISNKGNVELHLFNKYIHFIESTWQSEIGYRNHPDLHQGLPTVFTDEGYESFIYDFLYRIYSNLAGEYNGHKLVILDKDPTYCFHLDLIRKYIPTARFVHIIRDGRDMAVSFMRTKIKYGFGVEDGGNAAVEWRTSIEACHQFQKENPSLMLELKYETLLQNQISELKKIFDFIGIGSSKEIMDLVQENPDFQLKVSGNEEESNKLRITGQPIWKVRLSGLDRYLFYRHCGNLLFTLGYEQKKHWWFKNPQQIFIILLFHFKNIWKRKN